DSLKAVDTLRSMQESSFVFFSATRKYETVLESQSPGSAPLLTGDRTKAWSLIVKEQEDKAKEEEERKARNNNSYNHNNQSGRFNGTCNWCNKPGHMARDCHQKQRDNNRSNRGNGGGGRGRGGGNNANSPNNSANNTGGAAR
ncbi:MAG: hypothetical protein GY696_31905, partial [Gammaproteobacteria bacterium]|nr:hypothetical protein [Gammaproteobacteria bacterium]